MAVNFQLGMNAKIYQGAAETGETATVPTTELSNVRDVTVSLEAGEADITTRANSGWRATAATLRECTVEFEMVWKPSDTGFAAVKTAFLTGGEVLLAVLTGASDEAGAEGVLANFTITNFSRNEALEEAITVSVTAKLSKFFEWHVVSGS